MSLLSLLRQDFPGVAFTQSNHLKWVPEDKTIFYNPNKRNSDWSLLHEAGHMLADHKSYDSDLDLLKMEVEAWTRAKNLGTKYHITIDQDHIEDCLDSYRDWLHKRSLCPICYHTGIEKSSGKYFCINCYHGWQVTRERFCRVYRLGVRG